MRERESIHCRMEPCVYFLYLSHLLYGICVNIFIMSRYISKSYTRSKNTIYRAGAAVVSTITSLLLKMYLLWNIRPIGDFGKTVETGVDLCLPNCRLGESLTTSQCQVECWHVIVEVSLFIMNFLSAWKSKSWTQLYETNDSNKTGMGFPLSRNLFYLVFTLRHRRHAGGRQTKDRSLARFVCPPAFVHFTIVICVSRDCMKTTY